ncbi:NAD(P)-binding protein [Artomyces pyxidatus]|uniref:NAD(P)-binding protein n=1 Tax=Artomyces pyxidatus TaxID=48021 RepID=A0ACB8TCQ4_9AGAM|nr:NAD(P)-binding protein [Artomyces pyxidatus]
MSPKIVLVTGCSAGGIGFELYVSLVSRIARICEAFAQQGCRVYATARKVEKMAGFKHEDIQLLALDVNSDTSVQEVISAVIGREGKIDIVVNNAGIAAHGPTLEVPFEIVRDAFETNVYAVLRVARAAVPHMAARKQGLLVTIGSIAGDIPLPWGGIYAASKAAAHLMTEILSMECRPFNIDVMLVSPGGVKSNMPENSLYKDYVEAMMNRLNTGQDGGWATNVFAERVVAKALSAKPPSYFTLGKHAMAFAFYKWLPRSWVLYSMWKRFT